jgi:hypothetical protein
MGTKAGWGGSRSGAGRPLKGSEKRERVSATVPVSQIASLDDLAVTRGLSRSEALSVVIEAGLATGLRRQASPRSHTAAALPIPPDRLQVLQELLAADSVHHLRQVMLLAAGVFNDSQGVGQALRTLGLVLPTFGGEPVTTGSRYVWSWDKFAVLAGPEWTDDIDWGLIVYPRDLWESMDRQRQKWEKPKPKKQPWKPEDLWLGD